MSVATVPSFGLGIKPFGPKTLPCFPILLIIAGVQTNLVKLNLPSAIFSIRSSEPTISAPLFLASSTLSASHKTAILLFFPEPFGSFTVVLKLKSPPFDCFKFILKDISIDSSNLVVEFFLTKSKISLAEIFLSLTDVFNISLYHFDLFFIFIL
jgi:hypothetical protein